jgi:ParB-like chromosome segregation protein Spo0J
LLANLDPDLVGAGTEHREAAIEAEDHGAFSFSSQTFDIEQVPPGRLRPDPGNPRRIDEAELATLTESLRHFGLVQPILARREDGTIIGGHQRLVAAQRLGLASVPVIFLDLDASEARLLGLALNKVGGSFDDKLLARFVLDLQATPKVDLTLSGFGEDELHRLLRRLDGSRGLGQSGPTRDRAAFRTAPLATTTRLGDLWQLGDHRLLCGSATSHDDVARLLDGRRAQLGLADARRIAQHPGDRELGIRRPRPAEARALDPTPTAGFVRQLAANLLDAVDGALYVFMSSSGLPLVWQILAEEGGHWSDTLVWLTSGPGGGPGSYQRAYQPIWFGWREGSAHTWCGASRPDVWKVPRQDETSRDPVEVPPALLERAMAHASRPGDLVLDLLGGAGSSIIAAERTGRVARALEIDPRSCDVAIARWSALTGGVPRRASTDGDGSATPGGVR